MEEKKINKSIVFSIVAVLLLVIVVAGSTFAYFRAAGETAVQEITTANLKMNFVAGEWVRADEKMMPISDAEITTKAVELPFTITNTGDEHMNVTIKLTDITMSEQLKDVDFRWGLFNAETGNALSRGVFADIGDATEVMLYTDTVIDAAEPDITNSYVLRIWIHDDRSAQDSFMGRSFSARVKVTGESVTYTPESCFTFDSSTGTISLYDTETCGKNVVVPKTIGGVTVTSYIIEDEGSGFVSENVIFPNTIKTLGDNANSLGMHSDASSVTVPEGVTEIGGFRAPYLVNLFLPDTITNMDMVLYSDPFVLPFGITTLNDAYIDNNASVGYILHDNLTTITKFGIGTANINSLEIPASVTSIKSMAFVNDVYVRDDDLEIILLGKTEVPDTFEADWNCISASNANASNSTCTKYATVTFRP